MNYCITIWFLLKGPQESQRTKTLQPTYKLAGDVQRYDSGDEDNFSQASVFWNTILDDGARKRLVENMGGHLADAQPFIQERAIANFSKVSIELGKALTETIKLKKTAKM